MKSSIIRTTLVGLCTIALLSIFGGCDSDSDGGRVVCEVMSVNGGNPLVSSYVVIPSSGDPYQKIDTVPVNFYARPYGCTVTMPCGDGPYTRFQVTSYDVLWQNVPGLEYYVAASDDTVAVDLTLHNVIGAQTNVLVPVYETASGSVLIVGPQMKAADWFQEFGNDPMPTSFEANARLVFHGRESGSSRETSFETGLRVLFLPSLTED